MGAQINSKLKMLFLPSTFHLKYIPFKLVHPGAAKRQHYVPINILHDVIMIFFFQGKNTAISLLFDAISYSISKQIILQA